MTVALTDLGRRIAAAYAALPVFDAAVRYSWDTMARDELEQFRWLETVITFEAWRGAGQPYVSSAVMRADVQVNRHLWVFAGGLEHPCRSPEEVFRGRAVHDVYGHARTGAPFTWAGEVAAFQAHAPRYSKGAWPALASDNLGQAAFYFWAPVNEGKPHAERTWPPQKVAVLPEELWHGLIE